LNSFSVSSLLHTSLHLLVVLAHVVGSDASQESDVIIAVKLGHFFGSRFVRSLRMSTERSEQLLLLYVINHPDYYTLIIDAKLSTHINFHFPVESIIQQKVVGHTYPVGFHGVTLSIVVVSDVG
jgi:hypothetical protein